MNHRIIKAVRNEIARCNSTCCGQCCPCQLLAKLIDELGEDEFLERLEENTLPQNVRLLYLKKSEKYK